MVLSLATHITAHGRDKVRSKPAFQESHIILVILTIYEVMLFAIDGWRWTPGDQSVCADPLRDRRAAVGDRPHSRHGTLLVSGTRLRGREI